MPHDSAVDLTKDIKSQLEHEWSRFRHQAHNPSNKGNSYENALKHLLDGYFSGVYEIITGPVFIDPNLDVFEVFDTGSGQHEIDVVGLFRQANPRIVFELSEMTYVPLEGIAFICEVKSQIDKQKLKHDLEKFKKIEQLTNFSHNMAMGRHFRKHTTTPPVKCLIYDQKSISTDTFEDIIQKYNCWDMILILEWDRLIINADLPIMEGLFHPKTYETKIGKQLDELSDEERELIEELSVKDRKAREEMGYTYMDSPLANFIVNMSILIPSPIEVSTISTLQSLIHEFAMEEIDYPYD